MAAISRIVKQLPRFLVLAFEVADWRHANPVILCTTPHKKPFQVLKINSRVTNAKDTAPQDTRKIKPTDKPATKAKIYNASGHDHHTSPVDTKSPTRTFHQPHHIDIFTKQPHEGAVGASHRWAVASPRLCNANEQYRTAATET